MAVNYKRFVSFVQSAREDDKEFVLKGQLDAINRLFSGNTVEEIFTALENDGSDWATKQLNILRKMVHRAGVAFHIVDFIIIIVIYYYYYYYYYYY